MFRRRLFQAGGEETAGFRSENASFFPRGSHALQECSHEGGFSIRFRSKRGRVDVATESEPATHPPHQEWSSAKECRWRWTNFTIV